MLSSSLSLLPSFSPYETIACLHTLAKCGIAPPVTWTRAAVKHAHDQVVTLDAGVGVHLCKYMFHVFEEEEKEEEGDVSGSESHGPHSHKTLFPVYSSSPNTCEP